METHGMKFVVDTTGVAKGFRDYKSAVDGIFASLTKFEAHVDKTMKGVAKASANPQALNAFKKAVSAFSKVDIDTSAARKLTALSAAMNGFKAPTAQQTANTRRFFVTLSNSMPDLTAAYRSIRAIDGLKSSLAGFKAPAASQAKNLSAFAAAVNAAGPAFAKLKNVSGISGVANELATISLAMRNLKAPSAAQVTNLGNLGLALRGFNFSNLGGVGNLTTTLTALGNFRAPSAAQIRNLQSFVTAVGSLRVPANAQSVADALRRIAGAVGRASDSMRGLRSNLGGLGNAFGNVGNQARGASIQMMGMQNAFSATFQAGSLLRSLLGSLTIAELGRHFFEATNAALQFKAQMSVLNKDLVFADMQLDYVGKTANRFGVDMLAAGSGFAKISIAASKSGIDVQQTRHIFEGLSTAMTVLGTTTAGQGDVWLALQQVMNKGYLSAEELNQQLNEKLPGAMAYATEYAESLGMSLEKGLKTKALDAAGVLAHIAKRMKDDFGPAVEGALMRPAAQMNILRNNFNLLFQAIGEAGANDAFAALLNSINEKMDPASIERYATAIGQGLKSAVDSVAMAFDWLYKNWDSIKGPLATTLELMGKWMLISGSLQIGRFIVAPLLAIGPALGGLRTAGALLSGTFALGARSAVGAMSGLTGSARTAGISILQFRASLASTIVAMRTGTVTTAGLAASFRALGVSATAAAVGGLRSLVALLGGPLLLTLGAAAYAVYQLNESYESGQAAIADNTAFLDASRKKTDEATAAIGLNTANLQTNSGVHSLLSASINQGTAFMEAYRTKMDAATNGLWSMAEAARAATIETLKLQQADVTKQLAGMQTRSTAELGKLASYELNRGNYGRAAATTLYQGVTGLASSVGLAPAQQDVDAEVVKLRAEQRRLNGLITGAQNMSNEDIRTTMRNRGFGSSPQGTAKPETEDKGGSNKKLKTFEQQANAVENAVDSLMKKLSESDPIGKLYSDFVKTLTDQAHVLLNDNGYKQFIENIGAEAEAGKVTVQSLIDTLANGGNLSAKTFDDLKKRYGEDVSGIIDMLKAQQAAYEDEVKDTTIKGLDVKFKAITKAMDAIGDSIPTVALARASLTDLVAMGKMAMPSGDGFTKWLTDLRSGATNAQMAMEELIAVMKDPSKRSSDFSQFLNVTGTTEGEVTDALERKIRVQEETARQAQIDLNFGERLLQQRNEEIVLLSMTTREADVLRTVQEEVTRAKAAGLVVTEEGIALLQREITAQQNLADQMARNKEFFENNGVRSYINELKDVGTAINDLDKNFLQSLEDQLFSLGTTGTFSFKAIFDTIQQGLVRFASQNIMRALTDQLFSSGEQDGGTPSIFSGLFKAFGFDYGPSQTSPLGSQANPMYVVWAQGGGVNALGNIFKGSAKSAVTLEDLQFKAEDPLLGAVDTSATALGNSLTSVADTFGGKMQQIIAGLSAGGGGGVGGILGMVAKIGMSLIPGGSSLAAIMPAVEASIAANPGIFKEGGYPGSPVARSAAPASMFANAPHYAQGTPNTSGGHPAILHDNEAVIPLSRGRKVPVELAGGSSRQQVINNNFNVTTPDANSFRKSKQQIATDMHMQAGRAYRRNHG